jgi:phosphoribosylformylglycinamidine cyclo-ligase
MRDELRERGLRLGGLAHITGGGLAGNLPRAVPAELGVRLRPAAWPQPPIFDLVASLGGLAGPEMRATFNCGVGMAAIVEPAAVDAALVSLAASGVAAWPIGEVRLATELGSARYAEAD